MWIDIFPAERLLRSLLSCSASPWRDEKIQKKTYAFKHLKCERFLRFRYGLYKDVGKGLISTLHKCTCSQAAWFFNVCSECIILNCGSLIIVWIRYRLLSMLIMQVYIVPKWRNSGSVNGYDSFHQLLSIDRLFTIKFYSHDSSFKNIQLWSLGIGASLFMIYFCFLWTITTFSPLMVDRTIKFNMIMCIMKHIFHTN